MMHNRLIGVTGVTGAGKDFLVSAANTPDVQVRTANLGTIIGEELAMDRDMMMDASSPERIREAQFAAYDKVVNLQPAIVTCHAIRLGEGGYQYDIEMEKRFNPSAYFFIEAPADLIVERVRRRNETGERKSPELTVQETDLEQKAKLSLMSELVGEIGCRLFVLNNIDEDYESNVALLRSTIQEIATPSDGIKGEDYETKS